LNKSKIRQHLIEHKLFDIELTKLWMHNKIKVNLQTGCKIRAVLINNNLAGWCGIQSEYGKYEIAIVIDEVYWGLGIKIFNEVMKWAKDFNHQTALIHFLYTRPEYKFLRKISKNVYQSDIFGSKFNTYEIEVKKYLIKNI
jgi:hypothetical protein